MLRQYFLRDLPFCIGNGQHKKVKPQTRNKGNRLAN